MMIIMSATPSRKELTHDLELVDGQLPLLDTPGLGIELNEDAIEKYRVS